MRTLEQIDKELVALNEEKMKLWNEIDKIRLEEMRLLKLKK